MKKSELPQDESALVTFTREVCYVKNEEGNYQAELSTGWEVKTEALNSAWKDIEERIEEAKLSVKKGEKSPIYYFMELRLMDLTVLAGYTGFWKFQIKRHMKPAVFSKLSDKKLEKYAAAFVVALYELKNTPF